jgi:light-regulated signal transduction histidine kinase (bacteriophytochrome)
MDGFSDLLLQPLRDTLDIQSVPHLERIQTASRCMGELINDLLSLSQVTDCGFGVAAVDLSLLASRILFRLGIMHPTRKMKVDIMPGLTATGDEKLLSILFTHLIDNACKFSKNRDPAFISIGRQTLDGEEVFYVGDNGIGFDMAFRNQLFKPFHKLDGMEATEGTGIGLVTALKIVERHGGRIWAESRPDAGATFYFTLAPGVLKP